ncbi:biotin/lipoyl-containing protein [Pseudoalteromonas sp. GB43]|tara:strand:+ start:394 stop:792 length:399 start_codon:yes stop_codon:yes gene_type:complete
MSIPIKIPELPNDIGDVKVANVHVDVGDIVLVNSPLFDIETDKTILEIQASEAGEISEFKVKAGDYVTANQVVGMMLPDENVEIRFVHSTPKENATSKVNTSDKKSKNHQVQHYWLLVLFFVAIVGIIYTSL